MLFMALDLAAWKTAARAGQAPADAVLHKQFIADKIKAEGEGQYSFVISTGSVDRDRDKIATDGWDLANYRKNPTVLWAHDSRGLPIGRAESILSSNGQLKARVKFAPADVYAFADTVRRLVDGGFLNATSVGFIPKETSYDEERGGFNFLKQELLEFSLVPIPANPEALLDAKRAGVDLAPLKDWCTRTLDGMEPGLWLPKDVAARALKLASGEACSVAVGAVSMSAPTPEALAEVAEMMKDGGPADIEKAGRTLSKANEDRLRAARENLDQVLAAVETDDEDDDKAAAPAIRLRSPRPAKQLPITRADVEAAVQRAVTKTVKAAVNAASGRLD